MNDKHIAEADFVISHAAIKKIDMLANDYRQRLLDNALLNAQRLGRSTASGKTRIDVEDVG